MYGINQTKVVPPSQGLPSCNTIPPPTPQPQKKKVPLKLAFFLAPEITFPLLTITEPMF